MNLGPDDEARIRAAAGEVIEQHHLPGISIGVVRGNDLVFCEGFGHDEIESARPMKPEMRQRIASITKTMIGLCVMALVDEGKLALDNRLVDVLPDVRFDGPASAVTLWHLLTHTSGIGEAPTLQRLRDVANPDRSKAEPPGDFQQLYPDGVVVEAGPGSKWAYANNGYALLGEIIVRCEGAPLEDVLERRIFGPLGMRDTDITGFEHEDLSACYHRAPNDDTRFQLGRAGIAVPEEPAVDGHNIRGKFTSDFNKSMVAAGGVQSTVPDMARYASALLRRGAGIVRPEAFAAMTAPQYCPDPRFVNWGLSFSRVPRLERTFIGHGGAYFGGWNSNLSFLPDEGIAVIQHMNVMLDEPAPAFRLILRAVLDAPEPAVQECAYDPPMLEAAPGVYQLPMPGPLTNFRPATRTGRIEITREGNALSLKSRWGSWKHGVRLVPCDPSDPAFFAVRGDPGDEWKYISLIRDEHGGVSGLRCDELVMMHKVDAKDP